MTDKIVEEILKKVKEKWSDETQIGFSELAIQDAIKLAFAEMKAREDLFVKKLKEKLFRKIDGNYYVTNTSKICGVIDKIAKEVFEDGN